MNSIKKYLAYNGSVRVMAIDATEMVQEIRDLHNLSNLATAALGRVMIVSSMIASTLKSYEDRLTIQIKGDGPLGNIVVCANSALELKGYITNPEVELPLNNEGKLDVSKGIGLGTLTLIKDIGLKDPYVGTCELLTGEIGDDFAYYFNVSEQTPSVVSVGVLIGKDGNVQKAGGYIIQPLPDCEDKVIDKLESINIKLPAMTELMSEGRTIDDIVVNATGDEQIETLYSGDAKVKCDCSLERIENTVVALGKKEALKVLEENGKLELTCNFCNSKYNFTKEDIEKLFNK
ncbi:MAG: Hsp33 family molecular chaperone HslO [Clostridia bacterium]|nr:Hsp33 family molecular chaperone HslO [Clostridia bacterium]